MARLSLSLLGPFRATLDGEPIAGFKANKVRALLAYLALEASQAHTRAALAGLLWPERSDRAARASLRNALATLRAAIGDQDATPPFLRITQKTIQLNPAGDHWLDVAAFQALAETNGVDRPPHRQLEEALALYRGDLLEGFSVRGSPEFEDWALLLRERLQRQALDALQRLVAHYRGSGEIARACKLAWRQVELAPWEEEAHRQLMRLLAQSRQRGAALAQYEACREVLAEELGVEPGPETTALYERIRDGLDTPVAPSHNLPAQLTPFIGRQAALAEIGERLRDPGCRLLTLVGLGGSGKTRLALEAAARQVGRCQDGVFFVALAPVQSVEAIVPAIAQAIGFSFSVGAAPKEQLLRYLRGKKMLLVLDNYEHLLEGAALASEILRSAPRVKVLVTSRSGMQVQGEHRFPVSGMSYPALTPPALAQPTEDGRDPSPVCRRGKVDALGYSAVRLFVEGARRAQPGFELTEDNLGDVVRICRLVEGMPLAILLAATWAEMLTPAEIAAEISGEIEGQRSGAGLDFLATDLRDAPERQRSMRAVFDHSWSLLSEREQTVMQALSVFRGGFTRAAAEDVAGATLRALMALVKRSLLRGDTPSRGGRYEMHELLRQYAAEKLALSGVGEAPIRDRHAAYYAAALQGWAADLKGPRQLAAIEELRADVDNARAAWDWAVEGGRDPVLGRVQVAWLDRALEGLCLFYEWESHLQEGEAACRRTADRLAEPAPHLPDAAASASRLRVLSRVLAWQGGFSFILGLSKPAERCFARALVALDGAERSAPATDTRRERALILQRTSIQAMHADLDRARQLAERSLALYRALGDRPEMAEALQMLGAALLRQADFVGARERLEESLALQRTQGDRRGMVWSLIWLSWALEQLGRFEDAMRVARESVAIAQQVGDCGLVEWANAALGTALRCAGRFAETRSLRQGFFAYGLERSDHRAEAWGWLDIGVDATHLGSYEEARAAARAALTVSEAAGNREVAAGSHLELGRLALAEGAYSAAQEWLQRSIAICRQVGGTYGMMGEALAALAYAARGLGQPVQARAHLGEVLRLAVKTQNVPTALYALPAAALLLVDDGARGRATELYALASRYPFVANSRWFEDVAGREVAAVAASTLPPDVIAVVEARGRGRDLWATVEELLVELGVDDAQEMDGISGEG